MRSPTRLLLVTLAAALPSCQRHTTALNDAGWWRLEGDRQEKVQRIALLQMRYDRAASGDAEMTAATDESTRLIQSKVKLSNERDDLSDELRTLTAQVDTARTEWMTTKREAAVGRSFPVLTSLEGRSYKDVTITRVTDIGIEFRHPNGSGRFAATELSDDQLDDFGIEMESALAAHHQEKAEARAYVASLKGDRNSSSSSSRDRKVAADEPASPPKAAAGSARTESPADGLALNDTPARTRRSRLDEPAKPFGPAVSRRGTYYSSRPTYYSGTVYYGNPYCYRPPVTCYPPSTAVRGLSPAIIR